MASSDRYRHGLDHDPLWYKTGVIYEVHVRAFYDSDADGTGDFRGLTEKLDYIKDLGVTAIWLLPFYPSPLKDDGYDIADYCNVHPHYGTLADFKTFLREAHRRGLRVITELVLNHTSDQHPWFQRARRAKPGSRWRNFYVWSETGTEFHDARIIFKDVEQSNWAWDNVANTYFWHRFFSHQPDLNYDSPAVHEVMFKVVDFWLDMGVDGLRLDAVPYLYEREGTSCENLPETHAFLKKLRQHINEKYGDRMLLGEANQWPEDAVAYFGQGLGDECHMAYHFPLMPRLFMAVRMEDRQPIVDILEQTPPIPQSCQWALFLRNHDELTLEMVTDEERDYMYRMYAHVEQARLNLGIRRRLAPLMNNDRKSIELLNALLFSLPGTPVLYYGDEIGLGENIFLGDRNGVRTPMQWSSDKNAGFSRANPQSLYLPIILDPGYHYEANNVEVQLANPHSLLWWMRRMLALRKRWRALGEGKCQFLQTENRKVLSYFLRYENETLLVVANLSRFPQPVELDLSEFRNAVPMELFGRSAFPVINERPYFLSLGPHSFYWFSLETKFARAQAQPSSNGEIHLPQLEVSHHWQEILADKNSFNMKEILPDYLRAQTWFKGKSRSIKLFTIKEVVPVKCGSGAEARLAFLQVDYVDGDTEMYSLPLAFATGSEAGELRQHSPQRILAELKLSSPGQSGVLYDAFGSPDFCATLLEMIWRPRRIQTDLGLLESVRLAELRRIMGESSPPKPSAARNEQTNSSVVFEDKLMLKLFRRLEPGLNPELEMGQFLNSHSFPHCQTVAGGLEYVGHANSRFTLAVVHAFIPTATNAWAFTLDALSRYYDRVMTWVARGQSAAVPISEPVQLLKPDFPAEVAEAIGTFLESARLLGVRTADLHRVLASDAVSKAFAPENSTPHHRRAVFQSMRSLAAQNLRALRRQVSALPPETQPLANRVAELEPAIIENYRRLCDHRFSAKRLRLHGDCRLGQVLWTGKDFIFIDFEGDASVPISERRLKHSPIRDVATMLRSFHYAAAVGLDQHVQRGSIPPENMVQFQSWLRYWNLWVSVAYLKAYFQSIASAGILPDNEEDVRMILRAYVLDRAMNELGRELSEGGARLGIPLSAVLFLLREPVPPVAATKTALPQPALAH
ncbi:MAG TPA: maltose alpha-D-glucosyltransferase [Verrucomicrobiae bacterium]|jgi:maltose alpha-D-glucosyltransferase/alpha-amylase|nr:maltose alpha-D-glucosyltransferase [Verrucomicrobiae bacterium]